MSKEGDSGPRPAPAGREIYLDNAATSWPKPEEVYRAVERFMRTCGGTPARGRHRRAADAGRILGKCRRDLQDLLGGASGYRLVFTSGATESLNLALKGLLSEGAHVVVTDLEHNSTLRPLAALGRDRGIRVEKVPARPDGSVDPSAVRQALRGETRLVVCSHASNVLGTPVDIAGIAEVAHRRGVPLLVDAAQTVGILPFNVADADIDLFAFTGHKSLLGPPGTGGLLFKETIDLKPLKEGGTGTFSEMDRQPDGFPERYESGSINMYGIAGLLAGVEYLARHGVGEIHRRKAAMVGQIRESLAAVPEYRVYGSPRPGETVGILGLNLGGLPSGKVAELLWEHGGVMVRAGLHCAPYLHGPLGTGEQGIVRVGLGFSTSHADVEALLECLHWLARTSHVFPTR